MGVSSSLKFLQGVGLGRRVNFLIRYRPSLYRPYIYIFFFLGGGGGGGPGNLKPPWLHPGLVGCIYRPILMHPTLGYPGSAQGRAIKGAC